MIPLRLLRDALAGRVDRIQLADGRLVRFRTEAAKEHDVFVGGLFQRVAHDGERLDRIADRHQPDTAIACAFRVLHQGEERRPGRVRHLHFPVDVVNGAARRVDVFAVEDAVEDQQLLLGRPGFDSEALEHLAPVGPWIVCEGSHTASLAARMLSARRT